MADAAQSFHMPNHAGQVAFPGGKIEKGDASVEAAALREAQEEIGLDPAEVEILGRMDDYITGTGFHISPVVALVPRDVVFKADPGEVQEVFFLRSDAVGHVGAAAGAGVWRGTDGFHRLVT